MFKVLLPPKVLESYRLGRQLAEQEGKGLRVRLRIEAPDLAALPWEFIYDDEEGDFVGLSAHTPIVRHLGINRPVQPLAVAPPLRILGLIASPGDRAHLDAERERRKMSESLRDLEAQGLLSLTWVEGQDPRALQRAVRQGPWHVFHFVGHGGFDADADEGLLALADADGATVRLGATHLGRLLDRHKPRLAVLNACEGAQASAGNLFSSAASVLIRRGIPAVVAMQYEITDEAALEFSHEFYQALGEGLPIDEAVAEGRKAMSVAAPDTAEWGTPVLHLRAADGRLFDIGAVAPAPAPGGATRWKAIAAAAGAVAVVGVALALWTGQRGAGLDAPLGVVAAVDPSQDGGGPGGAFPDPAPVPVPPSTPDSPSDRSATDTSSPMEPDAPLAAGADAGLAPPDPTALAEQDAAAERRLAITQELEKALVKAIQEGDTLEASVRKLSAGPGGLRTRATEEQLRALPRADLSVVEASPFSDAQGTADVGDWLAYKQTLERALYNARIRNKWLKSMEMAPMRMRTARRPVGQPFIPPPLPPPPFWFCSDVVELNGVYFGFGSVALAAEARGRLDENADLLRECRQTCVEVVGYSDGVEANADETARARADAVQRYLVGEGVEADRVSVAGRGVDPTASSKEDPGPGDARARRVEAVPFSCPVD